MNFYLETLHNDIDIASLEFDIELDRANLIINYYSNMENFYKESFTNADEYFMEAGNKIFNAIKKAFEKAIETIHKCIEKVQEVIIGKKIKKLEKDYNEALKKDPSLKNKTIEYKDYNDIIKEREESIKKIKKYKGKDTDKEIEKEKNRISKMKPKVANIVIGSAFALIIGYGGKLIKNYKDIINDYKCKMANANATTETLKNVKNELDVTNNQLKKEQEEVQRLKTASANDNKTIRKTRRQTNIMRDKIDEYREQYLEGSGNKYKENTAWMLSEMAYTVSSAISNAKNMSEFADSMLHTIEQSFSTLQIMEQNDRNTTKKMI